MSAEAEAPPAEEVAAEAPAEAADAVEAPAEEAAAGAEGAAEEAAIEPVADVEGELEPAPEGIAINFETKHPLQRIWTMWYDNPGAQSPPCIGQSRSCMGHTSYPSSPRQLLLPCPPQC